MENAYIVLQTGWVQVSVAMLGLGLSLMEPGKRSWIILTCVVFLILLLAHGVHSLFLSTVWGSARDQYFVRGLTLWGYLAICITFGAALPLRFGDSMVRNISSLSIDGLFCFNLKVLH